MICSMTQTIAIELIPRIGATLFPDGPLIITLHWLRWAIYLRTK